MVRVAPYTHKNEDKEEYRVVDEKNGFFIYGEGWQKAYKRNIIEIPEFEFKGNSHSMSELASYAIQNREYFVDYMKDFGWKIIADQLSINSEDCSTSKSYDFLKHAYKHPTLLDYISEVGVVFNEFIVAIKTVELGIWTSLHIKDLRFDNFCFFDWMCADWQIYILNSNGKNTPFTNLTRGFEVENNIENSSLKETLNLISKSDLGDRIEKLLSYGTWLKN